MDPALSSIVVLTLQLVVVVVAARAYLRRVSVDRPPVGVFNGFDVAVVWLLLMVLPVVYLNLPGVALASVFALLSVAILFFTLSPVMGGRPAAWAAVALVLLDVALAWIGHRTDAWALFLLVNNLALGISVVGVANLWVQSGIRASHVALLSLGLVVYDAVTTVALPLMSQFVERISQVPLMPMFAWGAGEGRAGIGLGDLLVMSVWILVAEKAFSRRAGVVAAAVSFSCVTGLLLAFWADLLNVAFPAMVVLGPAIALHYGLLIRRAKTERTFATYDSGERRAPAAGSGRPRRRSATPVRVS